MFAGDLCFVALVRGSSRRERSTGIIKRECHQLWPAAAALRIFSEDACGGNGCCGRLRFNEGLEKMDLAGESRVAAPSGGTRLKPCECLL